MYQLVSSLAARKPMRRPANGRSTPTVVFQDSELGTVQVMPGRSTQGGAPRLVAGPIVRHYGQLRSPWASSEGVCSVFDVVMRLRGPLRETFLATGLMYGGTAETRRLARATLHKPGTVRLSGGSLSIETPPVDTTLRQLAASVGTARASRSLDARQYVSPPELPQLLQGVACAPALLVGLHALLGVNGVVRCLNADSFALTHRWLLCSLGIAKVAEGTQQTAATCGKLPVAPPEMLLDTALVPNQPPDIRATPASDVWLLGLLMSACLRTSGDMCHLTSRLQGAAPLAGRERLPPGISRLAADAGVTDIIARLLQRVADMRSDAPEFEETMDEWPEAQAPQPRTGSAHKDAVLGLLASHYLPHPSNRRSFEERLSVLARVLRSLLKALGDLSLAARKPGLTMLDIVLQMWKTDRTHVFSDTDGDFWLHTHVHQGLGWLLNDYVRALASGQVPAPLERAVVLVACYLQSGSWLWGTDEGDVPYVKYDATILQVVEDALWKVEGVTAELMHRALEALAFLVGQDELGWGPIVWGLLYSEFAPEEAMSWLVPIMGAMAIRPKDRMPLVNIVRLLRTHLPSAVLADNEVVRAVLNAPTPQEAQRAFLELQQRYSGSTVHHHHWALQDMKQLLGKTALYNLLVEPDVIDDMATFQIWADTHNIITPEDFTAQVDGALTQLATCYPDACIRIERTQQSQRRRTSIYNHDCPGSAARVTTMGTAGARTAPSSPLQHINPLHTFTAAQLPHSPPHASPRPTLPASASPLSHPLRHFPSPVLPQGAPGVLSALRAPTPQTHSAHHASVSTAPRGPQRHSDSDSEGSWNSESDSSSLSNGDDATRYPNPSDACANRAPSVLPGLATLMADQECMGGASSLSGVVSSRAMGHLGSLLHMSDQYLELLADPQATAAALAAEGSTTTEVLRGLAAHEVQAMRNVQRLLHADAHAEVVQQSERLRIMQEFRGAPAQLCRRLHDNSLYEELAALPPDSDAAREGLPVQYPDGTRHLPALPCTLLQPALRPPVLPNNDAHYACPNATSWIHTLVQLLQQELAQAQQAREHQDQLARQLRQMDLEAAKDSDLASCDVEMAGSAANVAGGPTEVPQALDSDIQLDVAMSAGNPLDDTSSWASDEEDWSSPLMMMALAYNPSGLSECTQSASTQPQPTAQEPTAEGSAPPSPAGSDAMDVEVAALIMASRQSTADQLTASRPQPDRPQTPTKRRRGHSDPGEGQAPGLQHAAVPTLWVDNPEAALMIAAANLEILHARLPLPRQHHPRSAAWMDATAAEGHMAAADAQVPTAEQNVSTAAEVEAAAVEAETTAAEAPFAAAGTSAQPSNHKQSVSNAPPLVSTHGAAVSLPVSAQPLMPEPAGSNVQAEGGSVQGTGSNDLPAGGSVQAAAGTSVQPHAAALQQVPPSAAPPQPQQPPAQPTFTKEQRRQLRDVANSFAQSSAPAMQMAYEEFTQTVAEIELSRVLEAMPPLRCRRFYNTVFMREREHVMQQHNGQRV